MITIKKVKIWKAGNSSVVTIPSQYLQDGLLNADKEYDLIMKESEGTQ